MTAMSASPELVTAAVLVIGDEILSGRTKDKNIGFIADYLTAIGIDLQGSARRSPTTRRRSSTRSTRCARATPMCSPPAASGRPTTTSPPNASPRRSASASSHHPRSGRDPEGAHGQDRRRAQRGAPAHGAHPARRRAGDEQGVGRARLLDRQRDRDGGRAVDHAGDARRGGAEAEDRRQAAVGDHPRRRQEGDVGTELGADRQGHPDVIIGSYPFFDETLGPNTNIVVRSRDPQKLARRQGRGRGDAANGEGAAGGGRCADSCRSRTASRAQRPEKIFPVSWDQFHRDARALAWRLHGAGPFDGDRRASPAAGWCRPRSWRAN